MSQTTQEAIDALTASTTAILTELITQKASYQTITQAIVDAAQAYANLAETSKDAAASSAAQAYADRLLAQSAKSSAEIAQASAESIVTGGTASTTPTASLIPLADTNGKIDKDWLGAEALAMSKQEFDALAEKRKVDSAGSGFAEWGKHLDDFGSGYQMVGEGLNANNNLPEKMQMGIGSVSTSRQDGKSSSNFPVVGVNGCRLSVLGTAVNPANWQGNDIKFPPAPDGSIVVHGDGSQTEYASAAEAIAGYAGLDYTSFFGTTNQSKFGVFTDYLHIKLEGTGDGGSSLGILDFGADIDQEWYVDYEVFDHVEGGVSFYVYSEHGDGVVISGAASDANGRYSAKFKLSDFNGAVFGADNKIGFYNSGSSPKDLKIRNIQFRKADDKPLASRQDFVFLEAWHEKISDKDWFCPLGNSQFGASSFDGISGLSNSTIAQGYSAFGDWDLDTKGYGHTWSTMSEDEKLIAIQNPENNIYRDGDDLIQVRYRVRVVKGLGDDWEAINPQEQENQLAYAVNSPDGAKRMMPKGQLIEMNYDDLDGATYYYGPPSHSNSVEDDGLGVYAAWGNGGIGRPESHAHNGLLFALPIALVQRRNQGAYHPAYNPEGCTSYWASENAGNAAWYSATSNDMLNTFDCFEFKSMGDLPTHVGFPVAEANGTPWGHIKAAGLGQLKRPDEKAYDAIYASDVQDLRMSSRKVALAQVREEYKRKAIAGEVRGFESVPYTKVMVEPTVIARSFATRVVNFGAIFYGDEGKKVHLYNATDNYVFEGVITTYYQIKLSELSGTNDVQSGDSVYVLIQTEQTHKQAKPTWTDIIGDPANIAVAFPDGVEGQWIPQIPAIGDATIYKLNRKCISTPVGSVGSLARVFLSTVGDFDTWSYQSTSPIDSTANTHSTSVGDPSRYGGVVLAHYRTQAHFTEDAVNSEVLDLGKVHANNIFLVTDGAVTTSSIIGKVPTTDTAFVSMPLLQDGIQSSDKFYVGGTVSKQNLHTDINITSVGGGAAVKLLDYLSESNSVLELSYAYKEMIYDGGWGDNSKFEIADNQSTLTDDNGNTVKYGTASFKTQFFYDGSDI